MQNTNGNNDIYTRTRPTNMDKSSRPRKSGLQTNIDESQSQMTTLSLPSRMLRVPTTAPASNQQNIQSILTQLNQLGTNLSLVADENREPLDSKTLSDLVSDFEREFTSAFSSAQSTVSLITAEREQQEMESMAQESLLPIAFERDKFLATMSRLTDRAQENLTYSQQAQVFREIIDFVNRRFNEVRTVEPMEANQLSRLQEVASIITTVLLEQLSIAISNTYSSGPQITRQLISIITSLIMVYNYLPSEVRGQFSSLPYFGGIFNVLNSVNGGAVIVQNSMATVTTVYYLLRNAGIDTTNAVQGLGNMAMTVGQSCINRICTVSDEFKNEVSRNSSALFDLILQKLGDIATSEYDNFNVVIDSQPSSQSSVVQSRKTNTSRMSQASSRSVSQLLRPQPNGVNISSSSIPPQTQEQFDAIVAAAQNPDELNNPLIVGHEVSVPVEATLLEDAVPGMPVLTVERANTFSLSDSQSLSQVSNISDESEEVDGMIGWLFGPSSLGGKRHKKNMKGKKTRRYRKKITKKMKRGMRRRMTKKGRSSNRTLKRYKAKM